MKLEDIQREWEIDSIIDSSRLREESIKIPQLHSKYFKMFSRERLRLRHLEAEYRKFQKEKYEFFTIGPTEEQHAKGWVHPPRGNIIRSEVDKYLMSDEDIIEQSLRIDYQKEKLELLESIIDQINKRAFQIKNAIDCIRWENGG